MSDTLKNRGDQLTAPASAPQQAVRFRVRRLFTGSYVPILLALVVVIIIGSFASPYFLTALNLQNILLSGAIVSILAIGQFMVIVTAGIDLSVGAIAAFATVSSAWILAQGGSLVVAIGGALVICAGVGVLNGLAVVFGRITPFIATLGMMSIIQGISFFVQGGSLIAITNQEFIGLFNGQVLGISSPAILLIVVTIVMALVMRYTIFGRQQYAIGGNSQAALLSGLPVRRNVILAYVISGFLAGLAGLLLAAQLSGGSALVGSGYELDSIAAAVVGGAALFGGKGNPVSAVIGALLIGTISNIMNLRSVQAEGQLVVQGILVLLAVYLTSGGSKDFVRGFNSLFRRRNYAPISN
ncbi:ABC transporter permease [Agrococcus sp. KRD186]|uniref:ABC transporter permease n=1 Tax=Agrococcus sp. KRD186 TaxID=2729730 RepID=UPI0019D2A5A6|nr:ABC transporter permease [Agrococcus sp. KRD186]